MIKDAVPKSFRQFLLNRAAIREFLASATPLAAEWDYSRLRQTHPFVKLVGLVGFDTRQEQFVLLGVGKEKEPHRHSPILSRREKEVLRLVAGGYTNFQIARTLIVTENTVKSHLQNIFAKLNVRSRTEAAMVAVEQGWVA
jgi:DNA-binding NarL/FixJ family response regulator